VASKPKLRAMPSSSFRSTVNVTHIGNATAILAIDDVNFLLDPAFNQSGEFTLQSGSDVLLTKTDDPALALEQLPVIHAVLLSHEDHVDNLDDSGRTLLNGRHVFTTLDGAKKLAPRPGVQGLAPWQSTTLVLNGKQFKLTATLTQHLPGGECTGFVIESPSFGVHDQDGLANVVYVSGDTVYIPELATELPKRFHVVVALLNMGKAVAPLPTGPLQITMGGEQAAKLARDIGAEKVVPLHFASWKHFTQSGDEARKELDGDAAMKGRVLWLVPGEQTTIV
jgi:L-ascorbate metabolism protein UlaG (beta-lactamase superfamily)